MFRIITILVCWFIASAAVTSAYAQRTGDPLKDAELADRVVAKSGNVLKLADDAPDRYTVKRGDTLWDIASKFLSDPWRWPELWRGNREQIENPHWIYPGEILVLDRSTGTLSKQRGAGVVEQVVSDGGNGAPPVVKLSPTERSEVIAKPIPVLPANVINPFLSRPLVLDAKMVDGKLQEAESLRNAPKIIGAPDDRYILSAGDRAYVSGLTGDAIDWSIFRPGSPLVDPDNGEILGLEAIYLGDVRVTRRGEPGEVAIRSVKQEILRGDRLLPSEKLPVLNYTLTRPEAPVQARLMSIYGSVDSGGQFSIVTINKGSRDGLVEGNVLALYRTLPPLEQKVPGQKEVVKIPVPDERYGLVTVFRITDRVSYGIVMEASRPLHVGDKLLNP